MYRAIYICAFFFVNMPLQKLLNCYIADNIYRYFCATCNNYFLLLLLLESIFDRNFVMFYYYLCLLGRQAELFFFFMSLVFDFYINNLYMYIFGHENEAGFSLLLYLLVAWKHIKIILFVFLNFEENNLIKLNIKYLSGEFNDVEKKMSINILILRTF